MIECNPLTLKASSLNKRVCQNRHILFFGVFRRRHPTIVEIKMSQNVRYFPVFVWWFSIISVFLSQNLRRYNCYIVAQSRNALCIYTKEKIGQTSVWTLLRCHSFRKKYSVNRDCYTAGDILERMQHGDGDITEWLVWYMHKLEDALDEADTIVTTILNKSFFWQKASSVPMTERQTQMLNLFLDGYDAKITSKTWATLAKCSKDTAIRDIQDLVDKNILKEDIPGAKRPSYSIVYDAEDLLQFFTEVSISEENGIPYLKAIFKGKKPVSERLLKLDAERFKKGDLPLSNLLSKYCTYMVVSNRG